MNELATQQCRPCQFSSTASYCLNIFSGDENRVLEHYPYEKCSRIRKMQIEKAPSELSCFGSFLRSSFRFQKNKPLQQNILKFRTISLSLGYV